MASITGDDLTSNGEPLPPRVPRLLRDALAKVRAGQLRPVRPLLRVDDQGPEPSALACNVPAPTPPTHPPPRPPRRAVSSDPCHTDNPGLRPDQCTRTTRRCSA